MNVVSGDMLIATECVIDQLFATPVYGGRVSNPAGLNSKIDECIDRLDFSFHKGWGKTHLVSEDHDEQALDNLGLKDLREELDKHVHEYCRAIDYSLNGYRLNAWFAKFEPGNYAHIHSHKEADIAGVYYYLTNGRDGSFFFASPNPYFEGSTGFQRYGNFMSRRPVEGDVLLFPGWMKHGVQTNEGDTTRISFSFNIFFSK